MKKYKIIILFIVTCAIFISCKTTKEVKKNQISEQKQSIIIPQTEIQKTSDFIDAMTQKILGNFDKAQEKFENCISDSPSNDAAWYELSLIYAGNLNLSKAIETAEKAYELDKNNKYYILNLAELYIKNFNTDKSIEMYKKLIALEPNNIEYQLNYTNVLLITQYYDETLKQLDVMQSLVGTDPEITLKKVKIYESQQKYNKAISELEKLANYYPKETKYMSLLADMYLRNGNKKEALECYKQIAKDNPDDPYIHFTLAEYYKKDGDTTMAHKELVQGFASPKLDVNSKISVLFANYSPDKIYKELNHNAYELLLTLAQTHPEDGRAQALLADYFFYANNLGMSRKYYYTALKTMNNPSIYMNLIQIESQLANTDSVFSLSNKAIELYPLSPEFYFFRGLAKYQIKDYEKAIQDFNEGIPLVVKNDPFKSTMYASLGDCYFAMDEKDKAYSAYDNSLLLNPDNYYVLNNYSYYLSTSNKNLEKAEIMGKKIVEAQPNNSYYLDTYGWALFKNNKLKDALSFIEKALKYSSNDKTTILEHLGDIKWKLNDKNGAIEAWKESYNTDPNKASELLKKKIDNQNYYEE